MTPHVYLITGANRGLGRGLLEAYIQRPDTTVIAGVRDTENETAKSLLSLKTALGSKVIVVKLDSTSDTSSAEAVEILESKHSIRKLDTVIANAGIAKYYGPAASIPLSEVREHFEVNTVGVIALFQATLPLLKNSPEPKFVAISSGVASIGAMSQLPLEATAYGMSKVALNYLVQKIHYENPDLIAFPMNPGWVQTDMGNKGAEVAGLKEAPTTLKDSVDGMVAKIDSATREKTSGTFESFDGNKFPW